MTYKKTELDRARELADRLRFLNEIENQCPVCGEDGRDIHLTSCALVKYQMRRREAEENG